MIVVTSNDPMQLLLWWETSGKTLSPVACTLSCCKFSGMNMHKVTRTNAPQRTRRSNTGGIIFHMPEGSERRSVLDGLSWPSQSSVVSGKQESYRGAGRAGGRKRGAEGLHKRSRLLVLNHCGGLQEIIKELLLANNSRQPTLVSLLPLQWFYTLAAQLFDVPNSEWKKLQKIRN